MNEGYWKPAARSAINKALAALPATATAKEKKDAIDAAFPFSSRSHWPYKVWLKERKYALAAIGIGADLIGGKIYISPLDRAKAKALGK